MYYLVQGTETSVRDPEVITGTYLPGTVAWEIPKKPVIEKYKNYILISQNQSVKLRADEENKIVFYYAPPIRIWK